jgi:hypothetical protein
MRKYIRIFHSFIHIHSDLEQMRIFKAKLIHA